MGTVDLRYCKFEQAVYFLDCTFYQEFNSGDTTESHTIYQKELNCIGSHFKKAASFNGIQVESAAYFHNCRFELEEPVKSPEYPSLSKRYTVDFATASFGHHLECTDAVFRGYVSFSSISCGGIGQFASTRFEKGANFTAASFGWDFYCTDAQFRGPAIFNSLRCEGNGYYRGVCFEEKAEKADFAYASFSRNLNCTDAQFRGPAIFNSLRCEGNGDYRDVRFEEKADFAYASFSRNFYCTGAKFKGPAILHGLRCGGFGLADSARFRE
jgi:hypothetical protein